MNAAHHCFSTLSAITDSFTYNIHRTDSHPKPDSEAAQQLFREEALQRLFGSTDEPEVPQQPSLPDINDIQEGVPETPEDSRIDAEVFADLPGLKDYTRIISNDPGYVWLLDRLHREIMLSRAADSAMESIRTIILRAMPRKNRISRKSSTQGVEVIYSVDWSPVIFLDEQQYADPHPLAVAKAITLTGSHTDAQALSCKNYLCQTWPHTGNGVLTLIERLLSPSSPNSAAC